MEFRFLAGTEVYGRMHVYTCVGIYIVGMPRHCKQDVVTESGRSIHVYGEGCIYIFVLPCFSYCLCILCLTVFAVRCFTTLYKFMEDRPHVPVQNACAVLGRRLRKRAGVFDDGEVTQRLVKNNRMAYTVLCLFVQARVLSDTVGGQGGNSRNHRARRQGSDNAQMLKTFAGPECGIEVHVYIHI